MDEDITDQEINIQGLYCFVKIDQLGGGMLVYTAILP